jgi:uncharacterized protein
MLFPLTSFASAINCQKASSSVEKSICSNAELLQLDQDVADAYSIRVNSIPVEDWINENTDKSDIIFFQEEWLKIRNLCKNDACLINVYKQRLQTLNPDFYGFTFNGKPINPECVSLFNDSLDGNIIVASIYLNSCVESNAAFSGKYAFVDRKGAVKYYRKASDSWERNDGFYSYRVLGKTDNGTFVLKTLSNWNGSLTSANLLLLKIKDIQLSTPDTEGKHVLTSVSLLEFVGDYSAHLLCDSSIKINGNKIVFSEAPEGTYHTWDDKIKACSKYPIARIIDLSGN